jgi:hypothetical protein
MIPMAHIEGRTKEARERFREMLASMDRYLDAASPLPRHQTAEALRVVARTIVAVAEGLEGKGPRA